MPTALADFHTPNEPLEVVPLCRAKRIRPEERDDHSKEIRPSAHDVAMQVLLVVVEPSIDADGADSEEALHLVQDANTASTLNHHKAVSYLISSLIAFSAPPAWLPDETDGEASLSVYKTSNPVSPNRPFLLIFRTVRIVTAHRRNHRASTGRILGFSSI